MYRATAGIGTWSGFVLWLLGSTAMAGEHAVLIGIADYPTQTGWSVTQTRDGPEVIAQLLRERGWRDENVRIVEGREATHDGMLSAIGSDLRQRVSPGDLVVVYYTGHGGQLVDESGDEVDGLDEVLVPWDADPSRWDESYRYVTDDELSAAFTALRRHLGSDGELVVLFDACSTGSASRGVSSVHAMGEPQPYPSVPQPTGITRAEGDWVDIQSTRGDADQLAVMTVFSAARSDEPTWSLTDTKGREMGVFTAALTNTLGSPERPHTWGEIESRTATWVSDFLEPHGVSIPVPQLDGAKHRIALSHTNQPMRPFLSVQVEEDGSMWLDGGLLYGVTLGDRVELISEDTRRAERTTSVAVGRVVEASALKARFELMEGALSAPAIAFVSKGAPTEPDPVSIGIQSAPRSLNRDVFMAAVESLPGVAWQMDEPELQLRRVGRDAMRLWHVQSNRPVTTTVRADAVATLLESVPAFARARAWWTLADASGAGQLRATVRAVEHPAPDEAGRCVPVHALRPPIADGPVETTVSLAMNQGFVVDVQNDTAEPLWLTAVVVMPTGEVAPLYGPTLHRGDPLAPGSFATLNAVCATTGPPEGPLLLHVFGTPSPLETTWLEFGLKGQLPADGAAAGGVARGARRAALGHQTTVVLEVLNE